MEQIAVQDAVAEAVDEAKAGGSILQIGEAAKQIRARYPDCQLPAREIADIVAKQAIAAGVAIQFTDPG